MSNSPISPGGAPTPRESDAPPMSIASRADQFTKGANIGVDVGGIERELASLWRQASSSGDRAVTRACSWNLLVHVGEDEDVEGVRALVDKVVFPVPSRAIVLVPRPTGQGRDIEAYVSANCQVAPGGGKLLCSEEITIMSRGGGERFVPALVRALLVPDVPTALLWLGKLPKGPQDIAYLPSVDRLILDSARAADFAAFAGVKDIALADLAWLRMGFLRSMLAAMFDPPTGSEPLERATEIVVRGAKNDPTSAGLFAGWLSSRLGWSTGPLGDSGAKGTSRSGKPVTITLARDAERETPSGIVDVVIRSVSATGAAEEYGLSDAGDGSLVVRSHGQSARSKVAADLAPEKLVIAALGARGRDPLYRAALAVRLGQRNGAAL